MNGFVVHEHYIVSGQRNKSGYGKNGKWHEGGEKIIHSHPGGEVPHTHPHTGPSFFGHRGIRKYKTKATGEQFDELIPRTQEENTFEVIVTDSALVSTLDGLVPIGDTPIEALGFPAAKRMVDGFGLLCIVRDERTKKVVA